MTANGEDGCLICAFREPKLTFLHSNVLTITDSQMKGERIFYTIVDCHSTLVRFILYPGNSYCKEQLYVHTPDGNYNYPNAAIDNTFLSSSKPIGIILFPSGLSIGNYSGMDFLNYTISFKPNLVIMICDRPREEIDRELSKIYTSRMKMSLMIEEGTVFWFYYNVESIKLSELLRDNIAITTMERAIAE